MNNDETNSGIVIRHALEIMRLRQALKNVRQSVIDEAADTVWMTGNIETVVDYIDAILDPTATNGGEE